MICLSSEQWSTRVLLELLTLSSSDTEKLPSIPRLGICTGSHAFVHQPGYVNIFRTTIIYSPERATRQSPRASTSKATFSIYLMCVSYISVADNDYAFSRARKLKIISGFNCKNNILYIPDICQLFIDCESMRKSFTCASSCDYIAEWTSQKAKRSFWSWHHIFRLSNDHLAFLAHHVGPWGFKFLNKRQCHYRAK
jgi:hypothetical protein